MLDLDIFGNPEPLSIYLVRVDGEVLGCIDNIIDETTASLSVGLNQQYMLEFEVTKDEDSDWYEYIHEGMYLYVKGAGLFKMNQPTMSLDGQTETKTVTAYSCDSELEDKTVTMSVNMGLKTSMEYLVEYEDGETETLINPYTDIPYDWIVLYNTFPEQLSDFGDQLEDGHYGDPGQTGWIDVIDDDLISELTDIFTLIPRLKSKVSIDDETGQPVSTEYVITTYDTDDPNKVVMYELSPDLADRIEVLITYYTKYRNQLSLLPLALENAGGAWTLGEIYGLSNGDYSVCNMKYQFDINESIYSFLTNTLAQTINCLVTFDNTTRKVNVTPLEHLGENTGIVIAYDNLVNTLEIATEEERLTTRLKVSGGENLSIARVNFGSDYIDDLGYKMNAVDSKGNRIYVSDSLAGLYAGYIEFREEKREEYIELSKQYEEYTDKISELDNRVPNDGLKNDWGTYSMDELEGSLRTYQNLLAALEVLYKEDYGTVGLNPDGTINEDYIKTTEYWYDYAGYKSIIDEIECAIDVFPYYDNMDEWSDAQKEQYEELIKAWETDWSLYGITELQGKIDTYAQSMDIMLQKQDEGEAGGAGRSAVIKDDEAGEYVIKTWDDLTTEEKAIYGNSHLLYRDEAYNEIYDNWYAAKEYQAGLIDEKNGLQEELDDIQEQRNQIVSDVALENYFSPADCKTLYRLFHDAQYSNENILSTSIDSSSDKIDRMVELLEDARDQASLVSRPQLTFSVNLDNIMALPEFEPYWRELKPGNYALVQYKDDTYVKLRIIGYKFNPMLPTDEQFELTFSNFVRSRAYYRDWASIFNTSSSSISNSYGSSGGGGGGTFGEGDDIDITISNTMLAKLLNTEAFGSRVAAVIHDTVDAKVLSARLGTFTNARIDNLEADHVSVADLEAANAEIERLDADKASISDLEANYAHITNGIIDNATIDYADINDLNTHYAEIDLANVSNAWIDQGVIRDASISDAKIIGVSANKLTAGTIDASNINVANLRASNLIVDRVNGQPVLGGYTIVSKSSPGYEQMNPAGEGWFEFYNGNFFQTTDTAVDTTKTYYTDGAQVALYDQTYIDGVENTLNERIDGTIETFTGDVVPTLVNYPYTDWYDPTATPPVDNRAEHVGDLYYVINASSDYDGYCYRFAYDNTTHAYSWVLIKDSDVTAALSDISELQTFQSETTTWIEETDEGLTTIRTNQTALEGIVNSTIVSTTQLWFAKANTTAPLAPTAHVTTNNPSTQNTWNISEPEYSSSYPYYYYCYEWEYLDGTYGWSPVVRDIGKGASQTGVKVWFANANNTNPPAKPTSKVISDSTMGNAWRTVIPAYSSTYPYYYYCYQYEAQDGTLSWSDVVYDGATTKNQEKAPALSQVSTKVNTSTFNELSNTVSENSASITTLSGVVDTKADSSTVETLSNTVNTVSQTATSNSSKISNLTTRLGTNADGTAGQNDIVAKEAALEQDLDGFKTTVSSTYQTKADMDDYSTTTQMESAIEQSAESILSTVSETYTTIDDFTEVQTTVEQTANNVIIKATENDTTAAQGGAHIISSIINVATSGVTIDASKVNIVGVITAINNDSTTTIDGDKITTGTVSASAIDATSGTFSSANIPNLSADKITTGTLDGSLATITNINASNINSGTLNAARLNISDVITAINGDSTTTISGGKITTNSITSTQLAADSVTANEIAANAVTADEIAANAVTADKIMGNTITIGKIDTSDPSTAEAILNSEIDIGSNNFLSNTAEMNTWYAGQAASIEDGVATLTGSSSGWNGRIDTERYDPILYNGTTKYTLAFDYKSTSSCDMVICISSTDAPIEDHDYTRTKYTYWRVDPDASSTAFTVPSSGGEWARFVMPYRTIATSQLDQGSGDIVTGYLQFYARSDNTTIQLRHIQLERGMVATEWSPATADILSAISGNADNISVIDEYINGGIIDVSMTSSFSGSEVSMDNEDFLEAVSNELGTYHFVYDGSTWNLGEDYETLTGSLITYYGGGTNLRGFTVQIVPKQPGSGDPSPLNIRRISGHTEVNGIVAGKNLFDGVSTIRAYTDATNNKITTSYNDVTIFTPCSPNKTYTISKAAGAMLSIAYTKEAPVINTPIYGMLRDNSATSLTITTGSDAKYLVSHVYLQGTDTASLVDILSSVQVEEGSSSTTYEAYNGTAYHISFGNAGVVYGGELDILNGILTVTHDSVKMGDLEWSFESGASIFYASVNDAITPTAEGDTTAICSMYTRGNYPSGFSSGQFAVCDLNYSANRFVCVKDTNYSSAESFRSAVANQELVYQLSEPRRYKLLRRRQTIPSKIGTNNVWSDIESASTEIMNNDIVMFNGGGTPIELLEVPIGCTQDLHGYDNPWVGGNGINKYPILITKEDGSVLKDNNTGSHTISGDSGDILEITSALNDTDVGTYIDGTSVLGTTLANATFPVTISFEAASEDGAQLRYGMADDSSYYTTTSSWARQFYTYTELPEDLAFVFYIIDGDEEAPKTVQIRNIMIEENTSSSSASTSWQPYENICPIIGTDSISLYRNGKNLIDAKELVSDCFAEMGDNAYMFSKLGTSDSQRITNAANVHLVAGKQYVFSFATSAQSTSGNGISFRLQVNGSWQSGMTMTYVSDGHYVRTFTAPSGVEKMQLYYQNNDTGVGDSMIVSDVQLEPGYSRTSYQEIYNGSYTANVQVNDVSAYSGKFDAISGTLTIDKALLKITEFDDQVESTDNNIFSTDAVYAFIDKPIEESDVVDLMCDKFTTGVSYSTLVNNDTIAVSVATNGDVCVGFGIGGFSTIEEANEWVAANPITIVYPLTIERTYTLKSRHINALDSPNTIWSDRDSVTIRTIVFEEALNTVDGTSIETVCFSPTTLSNYSIVVTATPTRGDLIEIGVGESKSIEQRFAENESNFSDLNNQYDEMYDEVFNSIDGLSESFSINQEEFRGIVESITDEVNRTTSVLDRINTKTAGMDFTTENGLVLYGSEDFDNENFKLQLAAMAINFVYGALGNSKSIIASIVADKITQRVLMNISNVVIGERLMISDFAFIPRTGGNMCLKYLGTTTNEES